MRRTLLSLGANATAAVLNKFERHPRKTPIQASLGRRMRVTALTPGAVPVTSGFTQEETPMRRLVIRRVQWALAALMLVVGVTAAGLVGASPASATTWCATPGHAYLTQPGRVIFSGFEGNQQFGVPTQTYVQFNQSFSVGGNGIRPGTAIRFDVMNTDTGAFAGTITTRAARSNCVVNEEGNALFTFLAPGNYQVRAQYITGNTNLFVIGDPVTNLQVLPQPPAPDPAPYEPPPCYDFYCYY